MLQNITIFCSAITMSTSFSPEIERNPFLCSVGNYLQNLQFLLPQNLQFLLPQTWKPHVLETVSSVMLQAQTRSL